MPKGRSFTANSDTKAAVPAQTQEPRFTVSLGMNRCDSFPLLSVRTLSLASEQTLKDLKTSQELQREGEERGVG